MVLRKFHQPVFHCFSKRLFSFVFFTLFFAKNGFVSLGWNRKWRILHTNFQTLLENVLNLKQFRPEIYALLLASATPFRRPLGGGGVLRSERGEGCLSLVGLFVEFLKNFNTNILTEQICWFTLLITKRLIDGLLSQRNIPTTARKLLLFTLFKGLPLPKLKYDTTIDELMCNKLSPNIVFTKKDIFPALLPGVFLSCSWN